MSVMLRGVIALLLVSATAGIPVVGVPAETPKIRPPAIETTYPGLSRGPLRQACPAALPNGVLLRAGTLTITDKQLSAEIARAQPDLQPVLKKNGFFVVEQLATRQLLIAEARAWATETKRDTKKDTDATLIQAYLTSIAKNITVSDEDVKAFYEANKEMVGGASYESVAKELKTYVLEQKQQEAVDAHVNGMSARTPVEVDRDWLTAQTATMLDNPVDKARRSGKPAMIDFGRGGCRPCDMMTPILEELKKTYAEQCTVLFCHVGDNPLIAARYNVQSIPVQVFFDKDGREAFRHVGFFPREQILAKFAEFGVR